MAKHIYVDESERSNFYVLCAAEVPSQDTKKIRREMLNLRATLGKQVHMFALPIEAKRIAIDTILRQKISSQLLISTEPGRNSLARRRLLISRLCSLQVLDETLMLTFDASNSMPQDLKLLATELKRFEGSLPYRHLPSRQEPLLWIPDVIAWAYGRGGNWREHVLPAISEIIEVK